jgi:serine/threonine protein kinase
LYWHQGGSTEQQIKDSYELRDCLFNTEWSDKSLINIFKGIEDACAGAREKTSPVQLQLGREYRQYLRRSRKTGEDKPTKVLTSLFGSNQGRPTFPFVGETILNPILFLKSECFKAKLQATVGPIHGDLHPSNVIIDKNRHVHLIDFAWAKKRGHVLKDYVLMECSLRFMLFPHYVNLEDQLKVDKLLLSRDGSKKLESWHSSSPINHHYQTLGKVLTILRKQASRFLSARSEEGFLEYLAAEFLMLYGLMKFDDYNRLVAARALGLIAKRLSEKKFAA